MLFCHLVPAMVVSAVGWHGKNGNEQGFKCGIQKFYLPALDGIPQVKD